MNTLPIKLRDYQHAAVNSILKELEVQQFVCVELAPGTGKSLVVAELYSRLESRHIAIIVGNLRLAHQLRNLFSNQLDFSIRIFDSQHEKEMLEESRRESGIFLLRNLVINVQSLAQSYDQYIFIDINTKKLFPLIQNLHDSVSGNFMLIANTLTKADRGLFGKPVFTYGLDKAISDGYIQPMEFISGPVIHLDGILIKSRIRAALTLFSKKAKEIKKSPTLVLCKSIIEAELVFEVFQEEFSLLEPIIIHSKVTDAAERWNDFIEGDRFNVAIAVINQIRGIEIPNVKDLVLMRSFGNKQIFMQIISRLTLGKSQSEVSRIWDFGGNLKYFNSEMGTVEHVDITFPNVDERDPESNPKSESTTKTVPEPQPGPIAALKVKRLLANPSDDKPTNEDLLGREGVVSILKGIIDRDARRHLIIALFGRWGSGKSSVVNLLEGKYRDTENSSFIVFNAWQEEHSANMAAALANRIINQLYESKSLFQQLILTLKNRFLRAKAALIFEFVISIGIVLTVFIMLLPTAIQKVAIDTPISIAIPILISLFVPVLKSYWSHPFTKKIREVSKKTDFDSHLGLGHQIREQLSKLLKVYPAGIWQCLCSSKKHPLPELHKFIVVVDDLDRCSDAKIVETLEAIQLIVDIDGICVIIAVDHQMLIEAVASRYQKQRSNLSHEKSLSLARNFLGKILQITITLERPTKERRNSFIQSRLYAGIESEKGLSESTSSEAFEDSNGSDYYTEMVTPFDVANFNDDEEEEYDLSDVYLTDSRTEFDFFALCASVFDFHNPRTLIRIHNAVTLLKGLYPSIADNSIQLKKYMYMAFWFELFSISDEEMRKTISAQLFLDDVNRPQQPIWDLFKDIDAISLDVKELRRILFRVKNLSLPSGVEFSTMKDNPE